MNKFRGWLLAGLCLCISSWVGAQQISQTITLKNGWNTIYLRVTPNETVSEIFKDWPVQSVSVYNAAVYLNMQQYYTNRTEVNAEVSPFWIWSREVPGLNDGAQLMGDSILVCFNHYGDAWTTTLKGAPVAPRIAWHKTTESLQGLNYIGISVQGGAPIDVNKYFEGQIITPVYKLQGTNEAAPMLRKLTVDMEYLLTDSTVRLYSSDKVKDFSGVLYVSPQTGPDFGKDGTVTTFSVRNDGQTTRTISVDYGRGVDNCFFPELLWKDDTIAVVPEWKVAVWPLSRKLDPGETWTITLGLDRRQFDRDAVVASCGGILTITEDGPSKMYAQIPVTAQSDPAGRSSYPAGLWVAQVSLSQVDRIKNDGTRIENLTAGGTMGFRLLMHINNEGKARLLQRVTLAGHEDNEGNTLVNLYAGGVDIPTSVKSSYRISSVALPTDLPIIEATSGAFGDVATGAGRAGGLRFDYLIDSESPSNPFRHPFHPDHDGYDFDFKTKLPDGGDFSAYNQTVKPELFPIKGTVILQWKSGAGINGWTPDATAEGTIWWGYGAEDGTGSLRHEGPIWAKGTFSMQRISSDGNLIER